MNQLNGNEGKLRSKLVSDVVLMLIAQSMTIFVPLALFPFIVRTYSADGLGLFVYSISFIQLLFLVTDFGMGVYGVKKTNELNFNKALVARMLTAISVMKLGFLAVFLSVLLLILKLKKTDILLVCLLSFPAILFQSLIPYWLFQAIGHTKIVPIVNVIARVSLVILAGLVMVFDGSITTLIIVNSLAWLLAFMASCYFLSRYGFLLLKPISRQDIVGLFRELAGFYFPRLGAASYIYSNTLILGAFFPPALIGLYGVSEYFYKITQALTMSVNQSLYPILMKRKSISIFLGAISVTVCFILMFSIVVIGFSETFIRMFYGEEYLGAVFYIKLFLVLGLFNAISVLFGHPAASIFDSFKQVNRSVYIGVIVYFLSLIVFHIYLDLTLASLLYSLLFAEFAVMLIRMVIFLAGYRKRNKKC